MKYIIEYSEKQHCFHLNHKDSTGKIRHELFTNDYRPITIVDQDTAENNKELEDLMYKLRIENSTYEKAAREILSLLA